MALAFDPVDLPSHAIEVARLGEAWGIKGWLKVLPFSADPQALRCAGHWYLQASARGPAPIAGTVRVRVREVRDHGADLVASIDGIDERDAAQALRGTRVFVDRSSFPDTSSDEYYWVDLIGLDVVNREGVSMGLVKGLLQSAAQSVLVLEYCDAGVPRERMIPFVAAYVDAVDLNTRRITVDWQQDY